MLYISSRIFILLGHSTNCIASQALESLGDAFTENTKHDEYMASLLLGPGLKLYILHFTEAYGNGIV